MSRIIYEFPPDYISGLISAVLRSRTEASKGACASLNSAIGDGVRIDGFRNASRADPVHQVPYGLDAFRDGDDRLTGGPGYAERELAPGGAGGGDYAMVVRPVTWWGRVVKVALVAVPYRDRSVLSPQLTAIPASRRGPSR